MMRLFAGVLALLAAGAASAQTPPVSTPTVLALSESAEPGRTLVRVDVEAEILLGPK